MFTNSGYVSLWGYDGQSRTDNDGLSIASSSDSEQDLRELEENLYSQIHYEPNELVKFASDSENSENGSEYNVEDVVSTASRTALTGGVPVDDSELSVKQIDSTKEGMTVKKVCPSVEADNENLSSSSEDLYTNDMEGKVSKKSGSEALRSNAGDGKQSVSSCQQTNAKNEPPVKWPVIVLDSVSEPSESPKSVLNTPSSEVKKKRQKLRKKSKKKKKPLASTSAVDKAVTVTPSVDSSTDSDLSSSLFCLNDDSLLCLTDDEDDIAITNVHTDAGASSVPNLDLQCILRQLPEGSWDVGNQDRAGGGKFSASRYYKTQSKAFCHNCKNRGHFSNACPLPQKVPACILCGVRGHRSRACPDALCYKCHWPGHAVRDCSYRHGWDFCKRCGIRGHSQVDCPDAWRQYHLTTEVGELTTRRRKVNDRKFCYNCAAVGHFGHECKQERNSRYTVPATPFIVKYDSHLASSSQKWKKNSQKSDSNPVKESPRKRKWQAQNETENKTWDWTDRSHDVSRGMKVKHGSEQRNESAVKCSPVYRNTSHAVKVGHHSQPVGGRDHRHSGQLHTSDVRLENRPRPQKRSDCVQAGDFRNPDLSRQFRDSSYSRFEAKTVATHEQNWRSPHRQKKQPLKPEQKEEKQILAAKDCDTKSIDEKSISQRKQKSKQNRKTDSTVKSDDLMQSSGSPLDSQRKVMYRERGFNTAVNALVKQRQVIQTGRGFRMTIDR